MHKIWVVTFDEIGLPAITGEKFCELIVAHAAKDGRVRDLVTVQVQDGEHGPIMLRIQKLINMPACSQWTGFRLAVANHTAHQQIRIVESRSGCMAEAVSKFSTLVDRARSFGSVVAGNSAWK